MIPAGATVEKAVLSMYSYDDYFGFSTPNSTKEMYEITSTWSENSISWSNKPTSSMMKIATSNESDTKVWELFDVTSVIKGVVENNKTCHGFYITFPKSSYGVKMRSSEYSEMEFRPKLTVECELPNPITNGRKAKTTYDLFLSNSCVRYSIPDNSNNTPVSIKLYDTQGKLIRTLVDKAEKSGSHSVTLKNSLAKGIYLCMLQAGSVQKTIRVVTK